VAALRAHMRAGRERLHDTLAADRPIWPAVGALLRGVGWWDRFHWLPGTRRRESEGGEEAGPPSVLNGLGQARLGTGAVVVIPALPMRLRGQAAGHTLEMKLFDMERVVCAHQLQGFLVEGSRAAGWRCAGGLWRAGSPPCDGVYCPASGGPLCVERSGGS